MALEAREGRSGMKGLDFSPADTSCLCALYLSSRLLYLRLAGRIGSFVSGYFPEQLTRGGGYVGEWMLSCPFT